MEEDVLGTMRSVHAPDNASHMVACSRCAQMVPVAETHLIQGDALDAGSEYEQLCASCYAALLAGERDLGAAEP